MNHPPAENGPTRATRAGVPLSHEPAEVLWVELVKATTVDDESFRNGPGHHRKGSLEASLDQIERLAAELNALTATSVEPGVGENGEASAGSGTDINTDASTEPNTSTTRASGVEEKASAEQPSSPGISTKTADTPLTTGSPATAAAAESTATQSAATAATVDLSDEAQLAAAGGMASEGGAAGPHSSWRGADSQVRGEHWSRVRSPRPAPRRPRSEPCSARAKRSMASASAPGRREDPQPSGEPANLDSFEPDQRMTKELPSLAELGPTPRHTRAAGEGHKMRTTPITSVVNDSDSARPGAGSSPPRRTGVRWAAPTSPSPKRRRRRRSVVAAIVAVLAIPAFAIGAVQPWLSAHSSDDHVSVAGGQRSFDSKVGGDVPGAIQPNSAELTKTETSSSPDGALSTKRSSQASSQKQVASGGSGGQPGQDTPSPSPTRRSHPIEPLAVSVHASDTRPQAGDSVRFTVEWSDGSGNYAGMISDWGDGSKTGSFKPGSCSGDAPEQSATESITHAFRKAGSFTTQISVQTYTCDGQTETQSVSLQFTVESKPSSPPSSPTPSPSAPPSGGKPSPSGKK